MAHYAWINAENKVIAVTVGVDEDVIQQDVGGSTEAWELFYTQAINQEGVYVKRTSYNHKIRKLFAGIGDTYDPVADVFIAPQPYPSWTLDDNFDWQPPTPRPEGIDLYWDEPTLSWLEITEQ